MAARALRPTAATSSAGFERALANGCRRCSDHEGTLTSGACGQLAQRRRPHSCDRRARARWLRRHPLLAHRLPLAAAVQACQPGAAGSGRGGRACRSRGSPAAAGAGAAVRARPTARRLPRACTSCSSTCPATPPRARRSSRARPATIRRTPSASRSR